MKFNINNKVKVKLTTKGLRILKRQHDELATVHPSLGEFTPPNTDEDGYAEFQLWYLMQCFGSDCVMGIEPPFETTIIIPSNATGEGCGSQH